MSRVFSYLDVMAMRIVPLRYSAPPICLYAFSSTGSQTVVLAPLEFKSGPTGLSVNRIGGGLHLSWGSYPGVICYTVYKLEDPNNPLSPYVVVAQCIEDTTITIPETGCETYIVTALTPDGESQSSETFTVGPDCLAQIFWNSEQSVVIPCPVGTTGADGGYTTAADLFGANSQAVADANALAYANANLVQPTCVPDGGGGGPLVYSFAFNPMTQPAACLGSMFASETSLVHTGPDSPVLPLLWSYVGDIPDGMVLALDEDDFLGGRGFWLDGVPTNTGVYDFSVAVSDSAVPAYSTIRDYTFVVAEIDNAATLTAATEAVPYSVTLTQTGAVPPVTVSWAVTSGVLPDGLTLDSATGEISGTPTVPGVFVFTVTLSGDIPV
jgi:hypothetical protein